MTDKERIAELEAAVEWAVGKLAQTGSFATGNDLRARAFPPADPQFEEVEKVRYAIIINGEWINSFDTQEQAINAYDAVDVFPIPYKMKRMIPAKVKRREEIGDTEICPSERISGARYFREWEE